MKHTLHEQIFDVDMKRVCFWPFIGQRKKLFEKYLHVEQFKDKR